MSGFIIVKLDFSMNDEAVVTAAFSLALVPERLLFGNEPIALVEPVLSTGIENAFVFPGAFQAYRWYDRLITPMHNGRRQSHDLTWHVRKDTEFFQGENAWDNHRVRFAPRVKTAGKTIEQAEADAFQAGVRQGERNIAELNGWKA